VAAVVWAARSRLVSFGEMFVLTTWACRRADMLVLADGDHGHGNAMNVQRTGAPMAAPAPPLC